MLLYGYGNNATIRSSQNISLKNQVTIKLMQMGILRSMKQRKIITIIPTNLISAIKMNDSICLNDFMIITTLIQRLKKMNLQAFFFLLTAVFTGRGKRYIIKE